MLDTDRRVRRHAGSGPRPTEPKHSDRDAQGSQQIRDRKVVEGDLTFYSKTEHRRPHRLLLVQRACEITGPHRQIWYELIPATLRPDGKKRRAKANIADFVYRTKDGKVVVEDVKGVLTDAYRLKKKLLLERHGIEIQEVRP